MNIYLTSGSMDFMESLQKKFKADNMIVMHGAGNSILLHETTGKTRFETPNRYEVTASSGELQAEGFFAFNHIPVSDEGKPIFEHRLQVRSDKITAEPGLIAFRFLRPTNSDTYIVITQWTDKRSFDLWKKSPTYTQSAHEIGEATDRRSHLFSSAPYLTTYTSQSNS